MDYYTRIGLMQKIVMHELKKSKIVNYSELRILIFENTQLGEKALQKYLETLREGNTISVEDGVIQLLPVTSS